MSSPSESKKTVVKAVTFKNGAIVVAADLYVPADLSESSSLKYAAILCGHPLGGCKEQTAGVVYAKKFSENGFVALAFDASYQGASGGEPHFLEDAGTRVEDFRCAVDFLVTLPYVDENRIGVLGVCGGGGYAATATITDRRIKALGVVSVVNGGRLFRESAGSPDGIISALEAIAKQRTAEARGAVVKATEAVPPTLEAALAIDEPGSDLVEGCRYYRTPIGAAPRSTLAMVDSRMAANFVYDAFLHAERLLTQPLQIVVGGNPGIYGSYRDGYDLLNRARSAKKNLFAIKGAGHVDLYWKPEAVAVAVQKLLEFYKENL